MEGGLWGGVGCLSPRPYKGLGFQALSFKNFFILLCDKIVRFLSYPVFHTLQHKHNISTKSSNFLPNLLRSGENSATGWRSVCLGLTTTMAFTGLLERSGENRLHFPCSRLSLDPLPFPFRPYFFTAPRTCLT